VSTNVLEEHIAPTFTAEVRSVRKHRVYVWLENGPDQTDQPIQKSLKQEARPEGCFRKKE
jgi:hypothetical protein